MCSAHILNKAPMFIGSAGGAEGKASNGKSTLLNWFRAILGSENVSSLDIATLGQRFQAGRILGKLANLGDDIPNGFLKGEELSMFKKLVTGDLIYTDVKGGTGYEFKPLATMVFSMNEMPRLSDTTDGVFRRLYFVPFRRRFTEGEEGYDPHIAQKLAQTEVLERGALLALIALRDLIMRGGRLPEIADMAEEMETVRMQNNVVLRWMADEDVTPEWLNGQTVETAYREFKRWAEDAGEHFSGSRNAFTPKVRNAATTLLKRSGKKLEVQPRMNKQSGRKERTFVLKDE